MTFTVDSSLALLVNKLTEKNDWQNRCGALFYSYLHTFNEEEKLQQFQDALEELPNDDHDDG